MYFSFLFGLINFALHILIVKGRENKDIELIHKFRLNDFKHGFWVTIQCNGYAYCLYETIQFYCFITFYTLFHSLLQYFPL